MKIKTKITTNLLALLILGQIILSPKDVSAAQPTVRLSSVKGEVTIKTGGGLREFPAVDGTELIQGDWLRTGKNGTAKLTYEDGTEATIGASSLLNIQRLSTSDTVSVSARHQARISSWRDGHKSSIELWAGSIWNKVKSLLNIDDEYEVETPTAVMGVRGTLYLVSVDQESGSTQSNVIDGAVGVTQNKEDTQAAPVQLVTMGKTLKLVSLTAPLSDNQVINQQEMIKNTQAEILVHIINDIIERTKELVVKTKEQQQTFGLTSNVDDIKSAIGTSFKLVELARFGKEFMQNLQKSDKLEEVKQVLKDYNQSIEQLQTTIDTIQTESENIRLEVVETAKNAGVSQDQIDDIGQEASGVPQTPASEPIVTPPSGGGGGGTSDHKDIIAPIITLNGSATVNVANGATYVDEGVTITDNKDTGLIATVTYTKDGTQVAAIDTLVAGTYVVHYNVKDAAGNAAVEVTRKVIVAEALDTIAPIITLNGSATVNVANGATYVDEGVTITDNKDTGLIATVTYTKDGTQVAAIDTLIAGTYVVHYNVKDAAGNAAVEVTRTVIVAEALDTIAPIITLNGSATVNVANGATYVDEGVTITDNKDTGLIATVTYTKDGKQVAAIDTLVAGTYVVHYNVKDAAGNAAVEVTRKVIVAEALDTIAPIITLNGSATVNVANGATYVDEGVTITDNKDTGLIATVTYTKDGTQVAAIDTLVAGTYVVHYNVKDAAGNAAVEVTRKVIVAEALDTIAPIITLNGSDRVNVANGETYVDEGVTITDNKDTGLIATVTYTKDGTQVAAIDTLIAGTYVVHYNVKDAAGNAAVEVTRKVIVAEALDTVAPVITLKGSARVEVANGETYVDAGVTITDNKDTGLIATVTYTKDGTQVAAIDTLVAGTYVVHYNVKDAAGNAAVEVTRTVIVAANTPAPDIVSYEYVTNEEPGGQNFVYTDISSAGDGEYYQTTDDTSKQVPIGFNFNFYGVNYNQVFVGSNGYLTFGEGDNTFENYSFHDNESANIQGSELPRIAPFFDDLIAIRTGSGIYYKTEGAAPNRKLIVQWRTQDHFSSSDDTVDFEAILSEGTNSILFQYQKTAFGNSENDYGNSATVGINKGAGQSARQFSYDFPSLSNGLTILFSPGALKTPSVPEVSANDTDNVIVGLNQTMEFKVDSGNYVKYDGTNDPNLSGNHTVQVRLAAVQGESTTSDAAILSFTELIPNSAPTFTSATITGIAKVGEELIAEGVGYADAESDEAGTPIYQWMISDTADGTYKDIIDATGNTYTPVNGDEGKFIKVKVTPVAVKGTLIGTPVTSDATAAVEGASALNVPISDFASSSHGSTTAVFTWTAAVEASAVWIQQTTTNPSTQDAIWIDSTIEGGPLAKNANTGTVSGLSAGTEYWFRLFVNNGVNGGPSNVVNLTTSAVNQTPQPTVAGTVYAGTATISGSAEPGATVSVKRNGNVIGTTTANGGTYTVILNGDVILLQNDMLAITATSSGKIESNAVNVMVVNSTTALEASIPVVEQALEDHDKGIAVGNAPGAARTALKQP